MENAYPGTRPGGPVDAGDTPTPLERSWIAVSMLLVWFAVYAVMCASESPSGVLRQAGDALACVTAGALVGLAVFVPANPSALRLRVAVYAVPVLGLALLMAFTTDDLYTALPLAFLPAWALVTALYGVRGGLSKGMRSVYTYIAIGGAGIGIGVVLFFGMLAVVFSEPPWVGVLGWLLPLLQLSLLLRPQYRRQKLRRAVETALLALLVVCSAVGVFPDTDHEFAGLVAVLAYAMAVFPTAALVRLGRADRSDTAEYQTRAERAAVARRPEGGSGPGLPQSDTGG